MTYEFPHSTILTNATKPSYVVEKCALLNRQLNEAINETAANSDESLPPTELSILQAGSILDEFVSYEPPAIIECLPDGNICFQWLKKPNLAMTLTFAGDGYVVFAYQHSGGRQKGYELIANGVLPKIIHDWLEKYFLDSSAIWKTPSTNQKH